MKAYKKMSGWLQILAIVSAVLLVSCTEEDPISGSGGNGAVDMSGGNNSGGSATMAPGFILQDLNDNAVKLSDYSGKVVVLFFFGNACPSCKSAAPVVQSKLVDAYTQGDKPVVLGLDQWDGNKSAVQSFKTSTGVSFTLLQKASSTAASYGSTYDRIIVIDKDGYIRFKGTRGASSDVDNAKSIVDQYLSK